MQKLPIFTSNKERSLFFALLFAIFLFWMFFLYKEYKEFISKPFFYTSAKVINVSKRVKNSRKYQVLKLKLEDGKIIYTTTNKSLDLKNKIVRIKLYPQSKIKITFIDYLRGFFIFSKILKVSKVQKSIREKFQDFINSQHKNTQISSFYSAIFLATPLKKDVRKRMSFFGINHLVALSGFHLGIISTTLFFIFFPIYNFLQKRFFPWRQREFDLGILVLGVLFGYLYFVDMPASLLRSYVMMLLAWIALMFWIELFSFEFLGITIALILAFFPKMVVSLSFWLSVGGVFYIFLILHYIKNKKVLLFLIPVLIHILMIPVAHSIFDEVSIYQWSSILFSWIFIPFYPISFILHLIGFGGAFDSILERLWSIPLEFEYKKLSIYFLFLYLFSSILAIRYKFFFFFTIVLAIFCAFYLYL